MTTETPAIIKLINIIDSLIAQLEWQICDVSNTRMTNMWRIKHSHDKHVTYQTLDQVNKHVDI